MVSISLHFVQFSMPKYLTALQHFRRLEYISSKLHFRLDNDVKVIEINKIIFSGDGDVMK